MIIMYFKRLKSGNFCFLCLIILAFLIVSLLMLLRHYFITPDSTYLLALGKNIVSGNGLTINGDPHYRYPPAYGTVAGLLWLVTGNLQASAHTISLLSGIGTIILVYFYTSKSYNRTTGLLAAALVGLNPLFGRISSAALGESFYALGYAAWILLIIILLKKPNLWMSFLAGLIGGILYLTRAEGFLFFPLGLIILLIAWWRGGHRAGMIIASLAAMIIGWLIPGLPYLLFLRENLGGWAVSGKITQNLERVSEALYSGDLDAYRETTLHEHESPGLVQYIFLNLPRVAERYGFYTWQALKLVLVRSWPALFLFIWFGILALRNKAAMSWHYIALASPLVVYPLAHIEIRYVTPYFIALAPVIGYGMHVAWKSAESSKALSARLQRPLVILTFALMVAGCAIAIYQTNQPPYEHRILADWMAENIPESRNERIAARYAYVNFYLGNEDFRYLPVADSLEESIRLARERGIDYFVIDERLIGEVRPELEPLLDPSNAPERIEPVVELEPPDVPERILLYRIEGE